MSVSADYSISTPINLYCNEAASDVVSSDADISEINSLSCPDFPAVQDENSLDSIFNSELDQLPEPQLSRRFLEIPELVMCRADTVNWMLKVHSYYQFRSETAYLSVNYLDRFLSSHTLPQGKGWPLQLLAVACLSLAAKMEETRVPLLLDIQILEPRFLFKPSTVQRMELLVLDSLKWRLHMVTPFDFLQCFIAEISYSSPNCHNFVSIFSSVSDLIINTSRVINFLDYTPSTIAAAAVLWVTAQSKYDLMIGCLHKRVNKEMVEKCYNLIKQIMSQSTCSEVVDATVCRSSHFAQKWTSFGDSALSPSSWNW